MDDCIGARLWPSWFCHEAALKRGSWLVRARGGPVSSVFVLELGQSADCAS